MSIRILNPVLSEICKIPPGPTMVSRSLSCSQQVQRIKRNLFGPANPTETTRLFAEELEKNQQLANRKWDFDFHAGMPLNANSQFIWERVSCREFIYAPQQYTLTRAAHVRPSPATPAQPMDLLMDERAERENFMSTSSATDTDSCDDSQDESTVAIFKVPTAVAPARCTSTSGSNNRTALRTANKSLLALRKRQPKITEYMKERKRLAQTPKKFSPIKRMRTSAGSSSTGNSSTHFEL